MAERLSLPDRIERDFTYHPPKEDQPEKYAAVRSAAKHFALILAVSTVECREQSLAITHLEEVVFWANAAISRNT